MIAQIKLHPQKKTPLFPPQTLPETIYDLLEKIEYYQLTLHNLLSKELIFPENRNSTSLKLFLAEIRSRLKTLMLSFDEVSVQMAFIRKENTVHPHIENLSTPHLLSSSVTLTEILATTKILIELFTLFQKHVISEKTQFFFTDLIVKALVFYKQTSVVLNGYLRIYTVSSATR